MKKILLGLCCLALPLCAATQVTSEEHLLKQISKGFCQVAKSATPAVVFIESQTESKVASQQRATRRGPFENPFDYFNDDFFSNFFGFPYQQERPKAQKERARGTGFLISADGYIVTNNHLIDNCNKITVTLNDGQVKTAEIIGADPKTDLAVLKIDGKDLPYLTFGNSDSLEVGDWLIAIGNPFGLNASVTVGVVSAKGRNDLQIADFEDFIQTDAAINPGNSGGPALTVDGKVVGVNTAIASASGGCMGIGFAIPSNMVKHVVDQLMNDGTVTRGFLGVSLQKIDRDLATYYEIDPNHGALVAEVVKDSPADKAGVKQEDIIIGYNGCTVENLQTFRNAISMMAPGSRVILKIKRDGKIKDIPVTITALPGEFVGPNAPLEQLGFKVKTLTPELASQIGTALDKGVVISSVQPDSPAQIAGLRPGVVIVAVNRKAVENADEFNTLINDAAKDGRVLLKVVQGESVRFIALHFEK